MSEPLAQVRFSAEQIRDRVDELAASVRADLGGRRPVLISVLKGSLVFMADFSRSLDVEAEIDFMMVTSFVGGASTGVVRIVNDLEISIQDRHVVVVETIVDTGLTLSFLLKTLRARNPRSLRVCALVDKPVRRIAQPLLDYVGFETEEFMVGYGLDFKSRYRNLPYLAGVRDVPALALEPDALIESLTLGKGPSI